MYEHVVAMSTLAVNTTPTGKMGLVVLLVLVLWHWLHGQKGGKAEVQIIADDAIAYLIIGDYPLTTRKYKILPCFRCLS